MNNFVEIPLVGRGNLLGKIALVDESDYDLVKNYRWYLTHCGGGGIDYATTPFKISVGKWSKINMHRLILNAPKGILVDHINHNGLDNRRNNIRLCNASENGRNRRVSKHNSSGFKGVSRKRDGRYEAAIRLGTFENPEDAAKEYDRVATIIFKEFANLNFPGEK